MKLSVFLLPVLSCAALAWTQTTTPAAPATSASPQPAPTAMKPRGPEAVAAQDPSRVVATIDGKPITAKQADDMLKPFPPEQRKQYESNLPNLIQQVYMREQLADAAKKLSLDQQSPWKEQIELTRDNILTQAYLAHMEDASGKPGADDAQKYFDAHQTEFDTVKLSGIFVSFSPPGTPSTATTTVTRTEQQAHDKADDLEKKLKAGGDFSALARSDSDNQQSATKGGDLGTYSINDPQVQIPADIKTAVLKLQPGQYSEPIHIPNGFLIVRLDKREKVTFDNARAGILTKLQTEKNQSIVKQEMDKYKIQVQDQDFFDTGAGKKIPTLERPGASGQVTPKPQP